MLKNKLPHIFFIILMIEILAEIFVENIGPTLIYATKPLLMPLLMYYYYQHTKNNFQTFDKIILGALFFSWWGDNFLMPAYSDISLPFNFLAGLGSFLVAHLLYIPAFLTTERTEKSILLKRPWLALPIVLLVFGLISFLMNAAHPNFIAMKVPVIVYASVIMIMVLTALNRYGKVSQESFQWVTIGAIMFMVSDSFIALSRFSGLFEGMENLTRILIMALYAGGQFMIAKGCIAQFDRSENAEAKKKLNSRTATSTQ